MCALFRWVGGWLIDWVVCTHANARVNDYGSLVCGVADGWAVVDCR